MESNSKNLISVSSLSVKLGVSTQTIYNRVRSGRYKAHKFQRGKLSGMLIDLNSVNEYGK